MSSEPLIEFVGSQNVLEDFARPFPAASTKPEWYAELPEELPSSAGGDAVKTVRECMPFLDAMTVGWLIPAPVDIRLDVGRTADGGLNCTVEYPDVSGDYRILELQNPEQLGALEVEGMVLKFLNPWLIATRPGYSCLFTAPMNRREVPFRIFSGVVETDDYENFVNFPMTVEEFSGVIERGTPMVQVVPFDREDARHEGAVREMTPDEAESLQELHALVAEEDAYYRHERWEPKPARHSR